MGCTPSKKVVSQHGSVGNVNGNAKDISNNCPASKDKIHARSTVTKDTVVKDTTIQDTAAKDTVLNTRAGRTTNSNDVNKKECSEAVISSDHEMAANDRIHTGKLID